MKVALPFTTSALLVAALLATGCATTPYALPTHGETELTLKLREGEPQFERGEPNKWVDGFGHYFFSLFSKLILLNWKVNNHDVSPEIELALQRYLHLNGLCNTKVRLNQYAPGSEWQRLFRNEEMPAGWRYTIGILSVSFYTIFPERLLAGFPIIGGGDHYNPYTNTVSIYSGSRPIVIHEGGHAKDFAGKENRHWKGAYAGLRAIPLVGIPFILWQEGVASSDALSFDLASATSRESRSAYRTLYPAYGTYIGGTPGIVLAQLPIDWWIQYAVQGSAIVAGHIVGQTRAAFVEARDEGLEPQLLAEVEAAPGACPVPDEAPPAPEPDGAAPVTPAPEPTEVDPTTEVDPSQAP